MKKREKKREINLYFTTKALPLHRFQRKAFVFLKNFAAIAQLVEHNLAKVRVASSSLVCRSKEMFFEYSGRKCPGGGIGRRARFRCVCRKVCRFESCSGHSYGEMAELVDALL